MKVGKPFIIGLVLNAAVLIASLYAAVNINYMYALLVWIDLLIYSYSRLEKRSMLFAFLLTFFVFLMGRDFLELFFKYKVENFSEEINSHAYSCYLVSLVSIGLSYMVFERLKKRGAGAVRPKTYDESYLIILRKLSFAVFIVSAAFAIISEMNVVKFVGTFGYHSYYTDYSELLSGNSLLYAFSKIGLMMPIALSIYMATMPGKKEFKIVMILYVIYAVISLGTGQRSGFMLGALWFIVYMIFRGGTNPEDGWFKRKYMFYLVCIFPLVAIFNSFYSIWREGSAFEINSVWGQFVDFFYSQGTSSNAVKRAYEYVDQIPKGFTYSFEFLRSGILGRILGIPIYHGNTIEHALYGGSFTHALGYVVLGTSYLAGYGPGSSYIAELFYDFSYMGVIIGSVIYSWLFVNISNIAGKPPFIFSICLSVLTQLLWAPRSSFSGFITVLFYPTTWIAYLVIFGFAQCLHSGRATGNRKLNHDGRGV